MNDILIINGIIYKAVKDTEVKEEKRIEGYTDGYVSSHNSLLVHTLKNEDADIRMIEIKENEIIVSEDEVRKAWDKANYNFIYFRQYLGFKKDGV